jgi:glutamate racemase
MVVPSIPHSATRNPHSAAPLGVFDSGIGGLTVARALFERLPEESVLYFGDTARVPYGPKSPETVRRYSAQILAYLLERGVKAVVVACNTSTAHALDDLRARSPVPVIGVIEPGARAAVQATKTGHIGIIGTAGTIASGAYERAIASLRPGLTVHSQACPLFVPLVEEGWFDHPAAELIAHEYLEPLKRAATDVLVLGCTHYPLLKPLLARVMGPDVCLVDSAEETAGAVARELTTRGLLAQNGAGSHRFAVSDDEPRFRKVGARFLGERLTTVEVVPLG